MNFGISDKSEIEKYEAEVKAKWGNTKAYHAKKQNKTSHCREALQCTNTIF